MARSHEKGKEDAGSFGHAYGWGVVRKGILESRVDKQMSRLVQEWQDSDPPFREYGQSKHRFRLSKQGAPRKSTHMVVRIRYRPKDSGPMKAALATDGWILARSKKYR